MSDEGGGASRSTDPATGSSAATDVSLREYISDRINALDRHMTAELASLRRESQLANTTAEKAIEVAAQEAKERLAAHNGLIEQMRAQAARFASREGVEGMEKHMDEKIGRLESFQSKLIGGMLLLSVVGVTNLVKAWTG